MALEITVGPPVITINRGNTFLVSELDGSITNKSDDGFYSRDTRYISYYQLFIDGKPWILLNSGATAYYDSRIYLVNPRVVTEDGEISHGTLGLVLNRRISEELHEDIDIRNYSTKSLRFNLEVLIRSDFADIFEVRAKEFTRRGHIETEWKSEDQQLITSYSNREFRRALLISIEQSSSKAVFGNGRINFEVNMAPGAGWRLL